MTCAYEAFCYDAFIRSVRFLQLKRVRNQCAPAISIPWVSGPLKMVGINAGWTLNEMTAYRCHTLRPISYMYKSGECHNLTSVDQAIQ